MTWLSRLHNLPVWEPPLQPTIVLAPHPDDETLGAGGLIARLRNLGIPVSVVAITDGEGAYTDGHGLGEIRIQEQTAALAKLGVSEKDIYRLKLPDRRLSENEDQLFESIVGLAGPTTHIVAPWCRDFHPDHEAAGRVAMKLSKAMNLPCNFYLFWTWHRGSPATLDGVSMVSLPLSKEERETKLQALAEHASQFQHPDGQPILSDGLLAPTQRSFEVYIRP